MEEQNSADTTIRHDLGRFDAFDEAWETRIAENLTAQEVVRWNPRTQGEARFVTKSNQAELSLVFNPGTQIAASKLIALDRLLEELGGGTLTNWLRIHHALIVGDGLVCGLTAAAIEANNAHVFHGVSRVEATALAELDKIYGLETIASKLTIRYPEFCLKMFSRSRSWFVKQFFVGDLQAVIVARRPSRRIARP